jgi:predicted PurR-regulated permease PerM
VSSSTLDILTDIAIIIIAVQLFVILLVPLFLFFFSIRGVTWAQTQTKLYGPRVRGIFRQAAEVTEEVSNTVMTPLLVAETSATRVNRIRAALVATFTRKEV